MRLVSSPSFSTILQNVVFIVLGVNQIPTNHCIFQSNDHFCFIYIDDTKIDVMLSVVEWNNSHPNFDEACSLFLSEVSDRDTKQKGYSGSYNQQARCCCAEIVLWMLVLFQKGILL